jgi:DNA-binding GntR family transcriptional regulator
LLHDKQTNKNSENLALRVYHRIREMMISYEIVPGQRLIFSDLAKRLGVSRTPVNSALTMLTKEGFLDFIPHQGYTVHRINQREAESLYEILRIITEGAIGRSIRRLDSEKVRLLEEKKDSCERAVSELTNREQYLLDQEFHAYIIEIAQIQGLSDYFRDIYQQIYLRVSLEGLRSGRAKAVVYEHQCIMNAIRDQNVAEAKHCLLLHLEAAKNYIFSRLFSN